MPEIKAMAVDTYARNFTAAELHGLIDFYKTPLGHKLLQKLPGIMSDLMTYTQMQISRRAAPMMRERVQPLLRSELAPLLPKEQKK